MEIYIMAYSIWLLTGLVIIGFLGILFGKKSGWQAGLRIASIYFIYWAVFGLVMIIAYALMQKAPENWVRAIDNILSLGIIAISGWFIRKYWVAVRQAGKLVSEIPKSYFQTPMLLSVISFILFLLIGITRKLTHGTGLSFALMFSMAIIVVVRMCQIREMGIMYQTRLIQWEKIAAFSWVFKKNKDWLRVRIRKSDEIIDIRIIPEQRYLFGDYLDQRLAGLYRRQEEL